MDGRADGNQKKAFPKEHYLVSCSKLCPQAHLSLSHPSARDVVVPLNSLNTQWRNGDRQWLFLEPGIMTDSVIVTDSGMVTDSGIVTDSS